MKTVWMTGLLLWTPLVWAADPTNLPDETPPSPSSAPPQLSELKSTPLSRFHQKMNLASISIMPPPGTRIRFYAHKEAQGQPHPLHVWEEYKENPEATNFCYPAPSKALDNTFDTLDEACVYLQHNAPEKTRGRNLSIGFQLSMTFTPASPLHLCSQNLTKISIYTSKPHMPCLILGALPALQRLNLSMRCGSQKMPDGTEKRATQSPIFTFPHTPHGETHLPSLTHVDFSASYTYPSTVPTWMAHKGVFLSHALLLEHTHFQGQCGWGAFYDQDKHLKRNHFFPAPPPDSDDFGYQEKLNNQFPVASFAAEDIGQLWSDIQGLQPYTLQKPHDGQMLFNDTQEEEPSSLFDRDTWCAFLTYVETNPSVPPSVGALHLHDPNFGITCEHMLANINSTRKIPEGKGWEDEGIDIDTGLRASFPMLKSACASATHHPLRSLVRWGQGDWLSTRPIHSTLEAKEVLDPDSQTVKAFALTVTWESTSPLIPSLKAGPFYVRCDLEAEKRKHYYAQDMITVPPPLMETADFTFPRPADQEAAESWLIHMANHLAMESLNASLPKPYEISAETTSAEGPGGEKAAAEGADRAPTQGPPPASSKNPDVSKEGDC